MSHDGDKLLDEQVVDVLEVTEKIGKKIFSGKVLGMHTNYDPHKQEYERNLRGIQCGLSIR